MKLELDELYIIQKLVKSENEKVQNKIDELERLPDYRLQYTIMDAYEDLPDLGHELTLLRQKSRQLSRLIKKIENTIDEWKVENTY